MWFLFLEKARTQRALRLDLIKIDELTRETGAQNGGIPHFDGELKESYVISILKFLIKIEHRGCFEIPLVNNGLGYNNLIYIALILSKLEINTDIEQKGQNAAIFPVLMIEEPEAHLNPALQYNFMQFLEKEDKRKKISRQIFVSTHSPHITSAVGLDSIICLQENNCNIKAINIGKAFDNSNKDIESKNYIERYLDATKANLLFSKGVIFVEGISELLLLPILARYSLNKTELLDNKKIEDFDSLEKHHVCIINVGGSTFKHFLKLFNNSSTDEQVKANLLGQRIACILDTDPTKKEKSNNKAKFKKCWPLELNTDTNFEYRTLSPVIDNLLIYKNNKVDIFYKQKNSKTFEYDLAYENYDNKFFTENQCSSFVEDIQKIKDASSLADEISDILDDKALAISIEPKIYNDIKMDIFASYYFMQVEKDKAEKALELSKSLKENFEKKLDEEKFKEFEQFVIPSHIEKAINFACGVKEDESNDR